ncbi:5'-methylthioadenosine/S-adenosylhomocysteine nucleosidase family protein [Granulosicoccus sp. 3-233]|uniref:5'-methylthioadenosine/S-adenosylhomocysteine nucleosidase family protein n=1 Tax=Granulosicoccus sp. 3-233 TaxID=3417969 RepID=UPI003D351EA8
MSLVCIVTALPAESRVFIDALKLRHVALRGMRLYAGEHYLLLQTGIGKLNAAAATAALLQTRPDISAVINAGIAGSAAEVGSVHLAHHVLDVASGRQWYPHLPPQRHVAQLPTASVHSVDKPVSTYTSGVLFDMEAAGILTAACTYLSTDAVQAVKVVSDNAEQGLDAITPALATRLMQACLPVVQQLSDWHRASLQPGAADSTLEQCHQDITAVVRHSVNDAHQLRRLLQQYQSLTGQTPDTAMLQQLSTARGIRNQLQDAVTAAPLHYEA